MQGAERADHGRQDVAAGGAHEADDGDLDVLDLVRKYGVIVDWGSGALLPRTTEMFRDMLRRRAAAHWGQEAASAR